MEPVAASADRQDDSIVANLCFRLHVDDGFDAQRVDEIDVSPGDGVTLSLKCQRPAAGLDRYLRGLPCQCHLGETEPVRIEIECEREVLNGANSADIRLSERTIALKVGLANNAIQGIRDSEPADGIEVYRRHTSRKLEGLRRLVEGDVARQRRAVSCNGSGFQIDCRIEESKVTSRISDRTVIDLQIVGAKIAFNLHRIEGSQTKVARKDPRNPAIHVRLQVFAIHAHRLNAQIRRRAIQLRRSADDDLRASLGYMNLLKLGNSGKRVEPHMACSVFDGPFPLVNVVMQRESVLESLTFTDPDFLGVPTGENSRIVR